MYKQIIESLLRGDASCLTFDVISNINQVTMSLINKESLTEYEVEVVGDILHISNIIYNNTDRSVLVLEDGIYDLLIVKYQKYNPNFQVGAEPVHFDTINFNGTAEVAPKKIVANPFQKISLNRNDMLFYKDLRKTCEWNDIVMPDNNVTVTKRVRNTKHNYPKLVGTLHKAKFTLDSEAAAVNALDQENVKVFERDFLREHVQKGFVNPNDITLVLELKYDGISVEADVTDQVLSARTRGDTGLDVASDLTPILKGYPFKNASGYNIEPFGMKFEAVINNYNLYELNKVLGKNYVNARTAIIGITGRKDASAFAKYITLVPLATSREDMNRVEELEFMNKYYSSGEFCRYAVIRGDYNTVLFQVYQFVKEAQMMRDVIPIMYDGVVVSYLDENIRKRLGRRNSINLYSIAIKFNCMKKLTRFLGYSYTVGQNGDITPMINYNPIEFFGTIHTKSSGHSFGRFKELSLKVGDILQVEYVNDVMPYVYKADVEENYYNPNPFVQFASNCPECGSPLIVSESGKNVICPNVDCYGRLVGRMTNMLQKLGFKGFSEETVKALEIVSFEDFMNMTDERASVLGEKNSIKLMESIAKFQTTPITDYNILGSLGFTGIASIKWKNILQVCKISDIIDMNDAILMGMLSNSKKGIGVKTAAVIINERKKFMKDIICIYNMKNVVSSNSSSNDGFIIDRPKTIRFSGVRDVELMMALSIAGHDCTEGGVTKNTDILLVPYSGFVSTKTDKALEYNNKYGVQIKIVPINDFRANKDQFLNSI
jgi:NAD-dependent DNA ligase